MTVNDYISDMFEGWGIKLSQSQLLSMGFSDEEFSNDKIHRINVAIVNYTPFMLLSPKQIKEDEFSISWDKDSVLNFYKLMVNRYGLKDELGVNPEVRMF